VKKKTKNNVDSPQSTPPPIYFPQHTKENNNYHGNKRTAEGYQRSHTAQ